MPFRSNSSIGKNATVDHQLSNTRHENLETYAFNNLHDLNKTKKKM